MSENAIRDELNRMKWHTGDLDTARIEYLHREGETETVKERSCDALICIGTWYLDFTEDEKVVTIPYHRITRLWRGDKLIWQR